LQRVQVPAQIRLHGGVASLHKPTCRNRMATRRAARSGCCRGER
jgi:hypothetical protein